MSVTKRQILGQALLLALPFFLAGCCFSARPCSEPIVLQNTDLCENVASGLQSQSFEHGEIPSERWWEMFSDCQLSHLIDLGLSCQPDIKLATARIKLAYEGALEARSALLPHFDLFTSYNRERNSLYEITGLPAFVPLAEGDNLLFNTATILLKATYELDIWGKNRNRYYSQLSNLQGSIADRAQAELVLASTIAQTYFNLQSHLEQVQILEESVAAKTGSYDLLRQRFFHGMADEFFVYITDAEVTALQDQLEVMRGMVEMDRHALAQLVGNVASCCNESGEICVALTAHYCGALPFPCSLPIDLLARRPDVVSQIWNVQASGYEVKVAKARFFPSFDLLAQLGSASFFVSRVFTNPALNIAGEAVSTLPLYTAGELRARLGQAQQTLEIAVESYNQTVLLAVKEVSDAITAVKTADRRYGAVSKGLRDSEALYGLTCDKVSHGIESRVLLYNALSNVYAHKLLESDVTLARNVAIVDVIRSIGGGYCGR